MNKKIVIYTDGSSLGNPGPGGYGAVLMFGEKRKEISGGFKKTTNNRMELLAVLEALRQIKTPGKFKIDLYSDSKYVTDAFNKNWIAGWERRRWKKVKNPDLWMDVIDEAQGHDINFHWVKGHSDNPENDRCDTLAKEAASGDLLEIDHGYHQ